MRQSIAIGPGYIKAEMVGRETPEETRQFVEAQLAALRESGLRKLLVSVKSSRPVFKVEAWKLSVLLDEFADLGEVEVALTSDTRELAMSHEYVALLAKQRGLVFRVFEGEKAAVDWLIGSARSSVSHWDAGKS